MKCKKLFTGIMAIVMATASVAPTATAFTSVPVMAASGSQDMYRLYNPNSGEHFYTASAGERNSLINAGWNYEGIGWRAPKSGAPVYRLYNPNAGDHHYTTSAGERDSLVKAGWRYEKVGWYSGGSVPLYRQYNPNAKSGTHNYTTNKSENDSLVRAGWRAENIGWYGVGYGAAADANVDYSVYIEAIEDMESELLSDWYDGDFEGTKYFLYDITGDGVKEMFIESPGSEAEREIFAYTIRNGRAVKIFEDGWGHSAIEAAQGRSLIWFWGHMGDFTYGRLRWNGSKIVEEDISSVSNTQNGEDYVNQWLDDWDNRINGMTHLKEYDIDDYSPL